MDQGSEQQLGEALSTTANNAAEDGKPSPRDYTSYANPVFVTTHNHSQTKRQPIYGLDWSSDTHRDSRGGEIQYVATAGGDHKGSGSTVTIYEVDVKVRKGRFKPIQFYVDEDKKESFYACAFAGRSKFVPIMASSGRNIAAPSNSTAGNRSSSDRDVSREELPQEVSSSFDGNEATKCRILSQDSYVDANYLTHPDDRYESGIGPKLLCVGGASNVIKVIDIVQMKTVQLLRGHNNDIYDLKVSPVDENLLLSCSVDETIRLWNLESFACVVRFAGIHGHSGMILSIAWHPSGDRFASSGYDTSIRLWNIHDGRVQEALRASRSLGSSDKRSAFKSIEQPFPYFATKKVHRNIVDCVHFCGNMLLSKSSYNSIVLWQPKDLERTSSKVGSAAYMPPDEVIMLRMFDLDHCGGLWFHRFTVNPTCTLLAIGNMQGEIHIWELDAEKDEASHILRPQNKKVADTVRNVSFNSEGSIIIACTDSGQVYKCHQAKT
jgi:WD40 repeat protein